jgi:DHA1 family multidrug resistance protein-like MFS transporter
MDGQPGHDRDARVLFMVRFAQMGTRPVMPLYLQELGGYADDRAASLSGWMFGAAGVASAVSAIYFGRRGGPGGTPAGAAVVDGWGGRALPAAGVRAGPWQLIALQAVFGVAAGGLIPAANAIVAQVTSIERRGLTFGVTAMAGSVGAAIGPLLLSSAVAPAFGFGASFLVVAVLTLGLAAYLWRALGRLPAGV